MRVPRYTPTASKAIQKLDGKIRSRVEEAIVELLNNPLAGKKLKGEFGEEELRSYRIWPYRIVYCFDSSHLDVVYVEHRKDVYR